MTPKAKSVIWIFLVGGMSQMESFDPKPALNKYSGMSVDETPFKSVLDSPYLKKNLREFIPGLHHAHPKLYPMQIGHSRRGQSGLDVSDWWPHLGNMIDDVAIVRSMWTTDNNHGAQLQFHTGRHALEGQFPTIGSWVNYGLGTLNENLPSFCVIGTPIADCCGGLGAHGANYLGPEHAGIHLNVDPANPLPFATPGSEVYREEQQSEFELLGRLNRLSAIEYPDDPALKARIKSYELAFRMQSYSGPYVSNGPDVTLAEGDDRIEIDSRLTETGVRLRVRLEEGFVKIFGRLLAAQIAPQEEAAPAEDTPADATTTTAQ